MRDDLKKLLKDMLNYMTEIGQEICELAHLKWGHILEQIKEVSIREKFETYLQEIPVLGFNSGKYDMNLMKTEIVQLLELEKKSNYFVIKKNNSYMCLSDKNFRFLDISSFLAPGCSYSKFLKAFQIAESKFYFPYEWFDDKAKLNWTQLPPPDAFYSSLKVQNTLGETETDIAKNYAFVQKVWKEENMRTFQDFLMHYNNLDVGPFVKAVEKMHVFYRDNGIDYLKETISVPRIARKMMFQQSKDALFLLCGKKDQDLYKTVKKNIIGGASIIFCRHHKVNETLIRGKKVCKNIIGYDCNTLYLWALSQPMPTGCFVRRHFPNFKPEVSHKYLDMYVWMDHLADVGKVNIEHKLNTGKEKRIGKSFCDGFDSENNVVYEMDGCFFHGHRCHLTENAWKSRPKLMEKREKKTREKEQYLKINGYRVEKIRECDYVKHLRPCLNYDKYLPPYYQKHKSSLSLDTILKDIQQESLFGMVDVEVPNHLYDYFSEMSPLFCTCFIPFDAMGEYTQKQIEELNLGKHPRKLLVGGMKAKRLLLLSPLLKWYLDHGLIVTQVYQVIEFSPMSCFKQFHDKVSDARRAGDVHEDQSIIADTMKLIGNSGFGSMIMDQEKHQKVIYVRGDKDIQMKVNDPHFKKLTEFSEDFCEVEMSKSKQILNLPIQIGYSILRYAKLKMLEWYYDCLDYYVERSDFEYIEMDTDSAYFAMSGNTLADIVKPHLKEEFLHKIFKSCHLKEVIPNPYWFPRECCEKHRTYDKRHAGLFKIEKDHGQEMVALCSKTYVLEDRDGFCKTALKGLNKTDIENPLEKCKEVLHTGKTDVGINKGFRVRDNTLFTYEQRRAGIGNFYCKRELVDDVHTKPLDIVLCPWEEHQCTEITDNILSPVYPFSFSVGSKDFQNIYAYCQTLKRLSVFDQNYLVKLILKKRWQTDETFKNCLKQQKNKTFVWVHEDIFWGCGLSRVLFKVTELKHMPGANQWGELLSELLCETVYTKNFEKKILI